MKQKEYLNWFKFIMKRIIIVLSSRGVSSVRSLALYIICWDET